MYSLSWSLAKSLKTRSKTPLLAHQVEALMRRSSSRQSARADRAKECRRRRPEEDASTNRSISAAVPPTSPSRPGRISYDPIPLVVTQFIVAYVAPPRADHSQVGTDLLIRKSPRIRNTKRSASNSDLVLAWTEDRPSDYYVRFEFPRHMRLSTIERYDVFRVDMTGRARPRSTKIKLEMGYTGSSDRRSRGPRPERQGN